MRAIMIDKTDGGQTVSVSDIDDAALPEGDVTIAVEYSTLNYKDSLAITGTSPVVRSFPMIPGVDAAGIVEVSASDRFVVGQRVVLNGWGVGERHWGGLAERCRLRSDWLIPLPHGLTSHDAMAIGTAGYTAMLCIMELERGGVTPADGEIIVTGATGGVGSVAIMLLSRLGFTVAASTGRGDAGEYLESLGAASVLDRHELSEPGRPLASERWAGGIDAVGSHTLANILAATRYGGTVAACGLAQGMDLPATVMPFILRGVRLQGVDSVHRPYADRIEAWDRLARSVDRERLELVTSEIALDGAIDAASRQIAGEIQGRIVVDVNR